VSLTDTCYLPNDICGKQAESTESPQMAKYIRTGQGQMCQKIWSELVKQIRTSVFLHNGPDLVRTFLPDLQQLWASPGPQQQKSINIQPKYGKDVVQICTKTVFSIKTEGHFFFFFLNVTYFNVSKWLVKF